MSKGTAFVRNVLGRCAVATGFHTLYFQASTRYISRLPHAIFSGFYTLYFQAFRPYTFRLQTLEARGMSKGTVFVRKVLGRKVVGRGAVAMGFQTLYFRGLMRYVSRLLHPIFSGFQTPYFQASDAIFQALVPCNLRLSCPLLQGLIRCGYGLSHHKG